MPARIKLQREDFDIANETDALARLGGGAIATFTGVVRGDDGLKSLTLEHYPGMTEREIGRAAAEAEKRWPLLAATIIHRVGTLTPGERIVLVAVASAHRTAAMEACQFLIDYMKTRAPFWKREERAGGSEWVKARDADDEALKRWL